MQKKLNNIIIFINCLLLSCHSAGDTVQPQVTVYPSVENVVLANVKAHPNGRFVLSKDDNELDIIKPHKEKIVRYNAPRLEHIVSKDVDSETTRGFWNVVLAGDDSEVDFIHNDIIEKVKSLKQEKLEEVSQNVALLENVANQSELQETSIDTKDLTDDKITINNKNPATEKNIEQVEHSPQTTAKTDTQQNKNGDKKEQKKVAKTDKKQFVPVRKIDEESLDMTNLKSLKVKEMPLIQQTGTSNAQIVLSMAGDQWIIKNITPPHLKLAERKNSDKNTIFAFDVLSPGEVDLIFVRTTKTEIVRQPYKITIKEAANNQAQTHSATQAATPTDDSSYKSAMQAKKQGKTDQAIKYFSQTLENADSPYYIDALTELINIHKTSGDYKAAENVYNKYTNKQSRDSVDRLNILENDFYVLNGDYKAAINGYQKFLADFPDSALLDKALFYLAYSLESYKVNPNYKEAYRIYNIIIDKYPESKYHKASINRSLYLERHYLKIN